MFVVCVYYCHVHLLMAAFGIFVQFDVVLYVLVPNYSFATNLCNYYIDFRTTIVSNPRRSLPDIPSEGQERLQSDMVTWEPSGGDNSSDLYASVDQYQNQGEH